MSYPPPRHAAPASSGTGIDLKTLIITAVASASAAYTCSKIWAPGTLAAAAFTPVIVAIVKEALDRSTTVVARAVPVKGVVRSAERAGPRPYEPTVKQPVSDLPRDAAPPEERVAQLGEIQYHGTGHARRGWRLAIITGLLGFLVCAVAFTVPELLAGNSATGGGRGTTLFGGEERSRGEPATTTTTTAPARTVTLPPARTVTLPAPAVTTTTPKTTTQPPAQTTTTPGPAPTSPEEPVVPDPSEAQPPG